MLETVKPFVTAQQIVQAANKQGSSTIFYPPTIGPGGTSFRFKSPDVERAAAQARIAATGSTRSVMHRNQGGSMQATVLPKPAATPVAIVGKNNEEDKPWRSAGEFLSAVRSAGVRLGAPKDPRLFAGLATGGNETMDAEGGFLVQEELSSTLIQRTYETGEILSRCDTVPMGSSRLRFPRVGEKSRQDGQRQGGITVYRQPEAAPLIESLGKLDAVEMNANKLTGFTVVTDDLQEDVNEAAMEKWLLTAFPTEFSFVMGRECFQGTGAGEFLGVYNSLATITIPKDTGQAAGTVTSTNVQAMWGRLWMSSRKYAAWFINPDIEEQLEGLTRANGVPLYLPAGAFGIPYATMLGRPVIPVEQTAAAGQRGDLTLVDMSEYLVGERSKNFVNSIHVYFLSAQNAYRWTVRNDGAPKWSAPVVPANGTVSRSPFIVLDERA